jgi:two-component system, OmpR family, sensor kinase
MSRVRLALAFAVVMAQVLVATGLLVYAGVRSTLDEQIDESLRARADTLSAAGSLGSGSEESFAQVVDARSGRVLAGTTGLERAPVLTPTQLEAARDGTIVFDRGRLPGLEDADVRVRASAVNDRVVIAGASLEDRDEALDGLRTQLLLVGPLALLAASLAGYALAAATLRPLVARLEAGLARERRFVAEASHELRTPLSLLKTELELALRRPRSPEELRAALASASEEADRLALLADDLLLLAHSDEGELRLDTEQLDARALLEGVARRFAARAEEGRRTLDVDAPQGLSVTADRLRLEQALGNLVDNALRYGSGAVGLRARARDRTVELAVKDEGAGFPRDFLPRAFERFSRPDGSRRRSSTGLGLSLAAAIAHSHGGSARAENGPAGGAEVVLTLPA